MEEPRKGCQASIPCAQPVCLAWPLTRSLKQAGPSQWPILQLGKFTRVLWSCGSWMGGLRSYSLRTLALGPAGSWEEERSLISVLALFRMSKLCLADGLVGVSGVSIPIGNSEESKESPGSTWPKDLIALKPGETSWDVVLKKIKELSDSVEGEGAGRRE